jgi:hypothetical protein
MHSDGKLHLIFRLLNILICSGIFCHALMMAGSAGWEEPGDAVSKTVKSLMSEPLSNNGFTDLE